MGPRSGLELNMFHENTLVYVLLGYLPSFTNDVATNDSFIITGLLIFLRRLAVLLLIKWPPPVRLCFIFPVAVTLTRLLNPLWVFCLGISIFPFEPSYPG